jgi:hypothetical protein
LSVSERRMLIAHWVSVTWESLIANGAESLIRQSFVETGFLVAKDGSENHLIKMAGLVDGYTMDREIPPVRGSFFIYVVFLPISPSK